MQDILQQCHQKSVNCHGTIFYSEAKNKQNTPYAPYTKINFQYSEDLNMKGNLKKNSEDVNGDVILIFI